MKAMNTKTTVRTEYAGFGQKQDGSWRKIVPAVATREKAWELLDEYRADAAHDPDLYAVYADYTVLQRTVVETREDWHEAE